MIGRIKAWTIALIALTAALAGQEPLKFMGREVTVTNPGTEDKDGMFPKGPATVCLEGTPRQCFTMPGKFGNNPHVEVVELKPGFPAILFTAESGGVSGWNIHFALLRAGTGTDLDDLLFSDVSLPNQNQHAFWAVPEISDAKIFVAAEDVWGPDEPHYGPHRYIVSSFLMVHLREIGSEAYYLRDRYMTARKYDLEGDDILAAEKPEILARLMRVKQQDAGLR